MDQAFERLARSEEPATKADVFEPTTGEPAMNGRDVQSPPRAAGRQQFCCLSRREDSLGHYVDHRRLRLTPVL